MQTRASLPAPESARETASKDGSEDVSDAKLPARTTENDNDGADGTAIGCPLNEIELGTNANPMSPATLVEMLEGPESPAGQTFYSTKEAV